jgi:hypothetical protein
MNLSNRFFRHFRLASLFSLILLLGCSSGEDAHEGHDHDADSNHSQEGEGHDATEESQ